MNNGNVTNNSKQALCQQAQTAANLHANFHDLIFHQGQYSTDEASSFVCPLLTREAL